MLVKITEQCNMGCTHCLSDCTMDGKQMNEQVFRDTIKFINKRKSVTPVLISGGEPTMHSSFIRYMTILGDELNRTVAPIVCVLTNGLWLTENEQNMHLAQHLVRRFKSVNGIELGFQISTDKRYYPKRVNPDHPLWKDPSFVFCDDCVENICDLGRAVKNKVPGPRRMGSSCFNIRAISRQLPNCTFDDLLAYMASRGKFCTPSININGDISLSESSLCKSSGTSIYSTDEEIIQSIIDFRCEACGTNNSLPAQYKNVLGI